LMEYYWGLAILFGTAILAGIINSVAGGGSLISFPALIMLGQPALLANATNTAAVWPGSLSSAIAYRRDTQTDRILLLALIWASITGGLLGAVLLVVTPADFFRKIVPFMILLATLLFAFRAPLTQLFKIGGTGKDRIGKFGYIGGFLCQLLVATYGGYFSAGIGILMLGSLSIMGLHDIHRMNGIKNILSIFINVIAFIFFIIKGLVVWRLALLMAVGTMIGGYAGARWAQRIDQRYIRAFVVGVGLFLSVWLFVKP
jgi:uncharacterized membrane protein YfcA